MGLDIYFHRFRNTSNDIVKIVNDNDAQSSEKLASYFRERFAELEAIPFGTQEYDQAWAAFYKGLGTYTNYPEFHFRELERAMPVKDARPVADRYIKEHYAPYDGYFRKVNFIYKYFEPKLDDEWCFVTKDDCLDIIDRCRKVLADNTLAENLLPTQSGFFFGSTEYDEWYFRDVEDAISVMEGLLAGWTDGERCYVVMSW